MEPSPDAERLRALKERLAAAQAEVAPPTKTPAAAKPPGMVRMGVDFAAAVLVGIGIGLFVDSRLGTAPIGLIVLFLLGVAAGFLNLWRLLQKPMAPTTPPDTDAADKG